MYLNSIKHNEESKKYKKRVGRGIGSGLGKTCGRGHKGQKSRAGGFHKTGFEGGQMPIQRRLPKRGFSSNSFNYSSLRLSSLQNLDEKEIDLKLLRELKLISKKSLKVKVYNSGFITARIYLKGIVVTGGVRTLIEQAGGSVS